MFRGYVNNSDDPLNKELQRIWDEIRRVGRVASASALPEGGYWGGPSSAPTYFDINDNPVSLGVLS